MRLVVSLMAVVVWAASGVVWAGDRPNLTVATRSERVTLVRDYLVLAKVSIERLHGLNFIIDTGANRTVIDHHLAKRLKLRSKTARITTLNTSTTVAESTISAIQVGSKRFPDVSVLILDLSALYKPFGERIDGVLGTDLLGRQKLEIDYQARTLTLEDCAPADFHVAFEAIAHLVSVKSEIAGRPVRLLVDTGASAMQLFADSNTAPLQPARRQAVGYGGIMQVSEATLQAASLGVFDLSKTPVFVLDGHPDELQEFGGLLSPTALGFHRICLDFPRGEFSWSR